MKSKFDYKEYSKWVENLGIAKSDFRLWLKQFLLTEAQRVVVKAKRRTPVDTGFLRNAYGIGTQKLAFKTASNNYNIKLDTEKSDIASIKVIGNVLQVEIWNLADYASFIEYGHHSYEGKYMLTISIDEVQRQIPARFNKEWLLFLKEKGVV